MAVSWVGQLLTDMALAAAPPPRPPQPIRATRMVFSSAAWTWGRATPAKAEAAANRPVFFRKSRRDVRLSWDSFIGHIFLTEPNRCQFNKSVEKARGRIHKLSVRSADAFIRDCGFRRAGGG